MGRTGKPDHPRRTAVKDIKARAPVFTKRDPARLRDADNNADKTALAARVAQNLDTDNRALPKGQK